MQRIHETFILSSAVQFALNLLPYCGRLAFNLLCEILRLLMHGCLTCVRITLIVNKY